MNARIPLILDTDIGSDIDDALCLAYLLKQPRCELLGVTTVTGDVAKRAALAQVVCEAAGRSAVPIHAGAPGPLLFGPGQPDVPQYDAVRHRPQRADFPPNTALEFLRATIRSRPGEVTLLGIGPATNLALLFAVDREIPSLLKELVLMCGAFLRADPAKPPAREWNARCDPVATAIVYRARLPRFTSIGLDVTLKCARPAGECRRKFRAAGGPLEIVAEMAEVWFRGRDEITFHDPLAGAAIFEPNLCEYAEGEVAVEVADPSLAGLTAFDTRAPAKPHRVAVGVHPERFFRHYFEIVGA